MKFVIGYETNACKILVGKPLGNQPLGRTRKRSVESVMMVEPGRNLFRILSSGELRYW